MSIEEPIKPGKILGNHEKQLKKVLEDISESSLVKMVLETFDHPKYHQNKFHEMVVNICDKSRNHFFDLSDAQLKVLKKHVISNCHLVELPCT